jgi:pimeloyl-ACP methyl ester carboxylesterase
MEIKNGIYTGADNRKSLIDLSVPEKFDCQNIVLFIHGYKGYKDWGCWNLVQKYFTDRGLGFAKINTSHNGGTIDEPIDFPDLDAFAENTYSYEVQDIKEAILWIREKMEDTQVKIHLIGHSRGGGEVVLAGNHPEVQTISTWAAISSIEDSFPKNEELEKWRKEGVRYVKNGRTNQDMPHNFSMYEDWQQNKESLSIEKAAQKLGKPCLHIHGDIDDAVSITNAEHLSQWTEGKMIVIRDGDHTFGSKHPWEEDHLPPKLYEVCSLTRQFIEKHSEG